MTNDQMERGWPATNVAAPNSVEQHPQMNNMQHIVESLKHELARAHARYVELDSNHQNLQYSYQQLNNDFKQVCAQSAAAMEKFKEFKSSRDAQIKMLESAARQKDKTISSMESQTRAFASDRVTNMNIITELEQKIKKLEAMLVSISKRKELEHDLKTLHTKRSATALELGKMDGQIMKVEHELTAIANVHPVFQSVSDKMGGQLMENQESLRKLNIGEQTS